MNLREIIRESINSVLLDSIISEEILHEASRATRGRYAGNRQANRYTGNRQQPNNLQQKRQQNVRQTNQSQQAASTPTQNAGVTQVAPQNNAGTAQQPQQGQQQPQQTTPQTQEPQSTQQPQQTAPRGQQQPAVDYSQYADELRRLVGNSGIDAKPVENNQAAVEFIYNFNHFVFDVINAIDSENINAASSAAAGGSTSGGRYNPYGKTGTDIALDGANKAATAAGKIVDTVGSVGGANNPFNGVGSAFSKAHNETNNDVANYLNQRRYSNTFNQSSQLIPSNSSLAELMTIYPSLYAEYQRVDQANNGIFNGTPNVSQCCVVLNNLNQAMGGQQPVQNTAQPAKPRQTQTVQNTAQPKQTQPAAATPAPSTATPAPGVTKPVQQAKPAQAQLNLKSFADNLRRIDSNGNRISALIDELEQKTLVHGREVDYHVQDNDTTTCITTIKGIGDLSDSVIEAIDNNSIYPADKDKTGITPLTELMSLGRYNSSFNNYDSVKSAYENNSSKYRVLRDSTLRKLMSELDNLYEKMKALVFKDKKDNR